MAATGTLLKVLVFFVAAFVFTDVVSGICMWRMPKPSPGWPALANQTHPVLPDLGFTLIPYSDKSNLPTNFLLLLMGFTVLFAIFNKGNTLQIFCRFFLIDGVLLCFRSVTIISTSLNNPDPRCDECGSECPTTMAGCVWMTVRKFPFFSCGDMMFSGHTVHFVLCALVFQTYYKGSLAPAVKPVAWALAFLGMGSLLACRYHYSIDVLIAFGLTILVWGYYHFEASQVARGRPTLPWFGGCVVAAVEAGLAPARVAPAVAESTKPLLGLDAY